MIQASNAHIDIIKDYQHNIEVHEVIIGKLERRKKCAGLHTLNDRTGRRWSLYGISGLLPGLFFRASSCFPSFLLFSFSLTQINQQPSVIENGLFKLTSMNWMQCNKTFIAMKMVKSLQTRLMRMHQTWICLAHRLCINM